MFNVLGFREGGVAAAMVEWGALHALWEKWASACVGYSDAGEPLKAAILLNNNCDLEVSASSRHLPVIVEQKGMKLRPTDVRQLIERVKQNNLQTDFFFIDASKYLVTSVHDHWYCARCVNATSPAGKGAIVVQTAAFILVTIYEGSIGAASEAMAATDYLMEQLNRRNL
uniref:Profilin n=1 Tax=Picea sitchensis TaxID=3332 RepID=D5A8L2_PICSI|nr:unknown [Picea sitchensis]